MCGIAGFLTAGWTADAPRVLQAMTDAIQHRGPDSAGHWTDPDAGIALGHRRLAIVDLTEAGAQPMKSVSGRYMLVFNGEIYNHAALRAALDTAGHTAWRGHSDTETLLAGFDRWGIEGTIRRAVGMFAIALWDRQERLLHLIRDRLGEKPLYYGWQGQGTGAALVFGSELKALRAHPAFQGGIDQAALAGYLRRLAVPGTQSIHPGLSKVGPGCIVTLSLTQPARSEVYWSAADCAAEGAASRFAGTPDEAVTRLEALLDQAIADQMVADVPLGAFLSGGVDSSTIVALMQRRAQRPVKSFSIGFEEDAFNEAPHAAAVARHLGTDHTEFFVTSAEARDLIPALPRLYDEPFADSSAIPTHLVSRLARGHVTVSLSGDGGDELFCGYRRYADADRFWRQMRPVPPALRGVAASVLRQMPAGAMNTLGNLAGRTRLGDRLLKGADLLAASDFDDLYSRMTSAVANPAELLLAGTADLAASAGAVGRSPNLPSGLEAAMLTDMTSYLPDDILTKVDRAAMAVSLETRVPLLDHRIVEFALSLPLDMKRRDVGGRIVDKWVLRQALYRHVPQSLIERPKSGFAVPMAEWLRGPLRDWAESLLDADVLRRQGHLAPGPIRQMWAEHCSGHRNWQYSLWSVLMFQAWLAEWSEP